MRVFPRLLGCWWRFVDFHRRSPSPRHNLIPRLSKNFRLGGTHWARQWIVAIRAFQEASHEAPGPCAECYLGLAAAYSGQYRDTDKKLVNLFTVRAYPTYLVIDGDGVITNPIVGANPRQPVVNQLVAILNDHATAPRPELKPSSPAILLLYEPV